MSLTVVLAESMSLAEHLGLDPRRFLEAIGTGAVGAPYAQIKGELMAAGEYPPSFPVRLALKDARLVLEAAQARDLELLVAAAATERYASAVDAGHGEEDMSAVRRVT